MRLTVIAAFALGFVGCGLSEEEYTDESIRVLCEKWEECDVLAAMYGIMGETADECITILESAATTTTTGTTTEGCVDYDGAAAADCVAGWEEATCDQINDFTWQPESCKDVCSND